MTWILACLSGIIMMSYILWTSICYPPQISLSRTYFVIPWKPLFTLVMMVSGFLMLPRTLDIVPGEFKLIPFLGIGCMILVGCAPNLEDEAERKVHVVGAIGSAIFSQLWIVLYTNVWITLILWLAPLGILGYVLMREKPGNLRELDIKLDRYRTTFWTELVCYVILYIGLLL